MACPALPTGAASFKEANGTTSSKISSGTQCAASGQEGSLKAHVVWRELGMSVYFFMSAV